MKSGNICDDPSFDKTFAYEGELGAIYTKSKTIFRVWAPTAHQAKLVTYKHWRDHIGDTVRMVKGERGTWYTIRSGDQAGLIYTYRVNIDGLWREAVDPYARAVTVNGEKGVVVDMSKAAPDQWQNDSKPAFQHPTDAIIYELHLRDLSIHPASGIRHKGKYLGLAETGTTNPTGSKTGLDHIKDLGVTHVQLMPIYDYCTVDEGKLEVAQYNWGYDPINYNVPEGSYATDPFTPTTRIIELKQMIQTLHQHGLRVIMDVVYNHMYEAASSNLDKLVPGYYYRHTKLGTLSNGTGVGNDTASERVMMRKLMLDSVIYWAQEYHMDGFRFDLMGIHDVETMNQIRAELDKIDPSILILGEGWVLDTPLPDERKANQHNAYSMPRIAHFNDRIRDGLKGNVFNVAAPGFVNGDFSKTTDVQGGIVGGIHYNEIIRQYAASPDQSVSYVEAHDNHTLWDKLLLTNPGDSPEDRKSMHKLATTIALMSQGIAFIHAGQEFLRTKGGVANSYCSPDSINQMDWISRTEHDDIVQYVKGLIALRKAHPAFRMTEAQLIRDRLVFLDCAAGIIAYTLNDYANQDSWRSIAVVHNANRVAMQVKLPYPANWNIVVNRDNAGITPIEQLEDQTAIVQPLSTLILYAP